MKALSFFLLFVGATLNGQSLYDDFTGSSLNTSKWQVILPYTHGVNNSSVTQSNGSVTTSTRGILATANQFAAPNVVSGVFTMLNNVEHFEVVLRSNLVNAGQESSSEEPGVMVSFAMDGQVASIQNYTSAQVNTGLATVSVPFVVGKPYSYTITDTGTTVTLTINGSITISAQTSYQPGNYIAFYSREVGLPGTRIDAVSIGPAQAVSLPSRLINLSTRGQIGTGNNILIGGLVIAGTIPKTVLLRAAGPALVVPFGLTTAATQTTITLLQGQTIITTNTGWSSAVNAAAIQAAFTPTGAFPFSAGSGDSAILAVLNPGNYTVEVSGTVGGIALVEAYEVP